MPGRPTTSLMRILDIESGRLQADVPLKGEKPLPRLGHTAVSIGCRIVVSGGWDTSVFFNDSFQATPSLVQQ